MDTTDSQITLHEAARDGKVALVESLLESNPKSALKSDDDDRLPIHWAASNSHDSICEMLLDVKNFDIDAQDGSGWTVLMIAASTGNEELVDRLLKRDASVDLKNFGGQTALHLAASKSHLSIAKRLLTSTRIRDKRSQLPLHRAAAVGNVPMVKLLLDNKSPLNTQDIFGQTPLHHAIAEGNGDVALVLLRAGAEMGRKDTDGKLAIELAPDAKVLDFITRSCEEEGISLAPKEK